MGACGWGWCPTYIPWNAAAATLPKLETNTEKAAKFQGSFRTPNSNRSTRLAGWSTRLARGQLVGWSTRLAGRLADCPTPTQPSQSRSADLLFIASARREVWSPGNSRRKQHSSRETHWPKRARSRGENSQTAAGQRPMLAVGHKRLHYVAAGTRRHASSSSSSVMSLQPGAPDATNSIAWPAHFRWVVRFMPAGQANS